MGALSFSSSEDSVSASFLLRCLSQHTFTKNTGEKPDVLDDEEADLLVLLVTQLELLLGGLLLLVGVHGLLRSLFLGGRDIIFVQIYIWLVNSGQKRISVTIQVLNYFSDSYNVTAWTQKKTSRNALEIWFT